MDLTNLISTETSAILGGNDIYNYYRDRWEYLYQSYIGGEEYTEAGHFFR